MYHDGEVAFSKSKFYAYISRIEVKRNEEWIKRYHKTILIIQSDYMQLWYLSAESISRQIKIRYVRIKVSPWEKNRHVSDKPIYSRVAFNLVVFNIVIHPGFHLWKKVTKRMRNFATINLIHHDVTWGWECLRKFKRAGIRFSKQIEFRAVGTTRYSITCRSDPIIH